MPVQSFAQAQALITTMAVATIGPFAEVFNELGLLMFTMGALGGLTGHFSLRLPFRHAVYPGLLGGVLGFSLGFVSPPILAATLDVELIVEGGSVRGLAAASFLLGVFHERVLAWFRDDKRGQGDAE